MAKNNNTKSVFIDFLDSLTYRKPKNHTKTADKLGKHLRATKIIHLGYKVIKVTSLGYCVGYTMINLIGYPASVNGKSMQPTLNPSHTRKSSWINMDWVWVNCWKTRHFNLSRGDLVVYTSPKDPHEFLIKRLIAEEGDIIHTEGRYYKSVVRIPQGHIWVEGDNWDNSVDSNNYGAIPKGLVSGVATRIIWPPSRMQAFASGIPERLEPNRVTRKEIKSDWSTRTWHQYWRVLVHFLTT